MSTLPEASKHCPAPNSCDCFCAGDLVIANDAATLPASLQGIHERSGRGIEVRLAARESLESTIVSMRSCSEQATTARARKTGLRLQLEPGDRLSLGPLTAIVERIADHPRLIDLRFDATASQFWAGLAAHGRPSSTRTCRSRCSCGTSGLRSQAPPVAYESPSAGFALDWHLLARAQGEGRRVRDDSPTRRAFRRPAMQSSIAACLSMSRIEFPATPSGDRARACATIAASSRSARQSFARLSIRQRFTAQSRPATASRTSDRIVDRDLRVVDAILSGTHEPAAVTTIAARVRASKSCCVRADEQLERAGFRTHEFGDSVLIERDTRHNSRGAGRCRRPGDLSRNASTGRRGRATYTPRFFARDNPCGSRIWSSIVCPLIGRFLPRNSRNSSRSARCSPAAPSTCKRVAGCMRAPRSAIVHTTNGQYLIALGVEQKLLPASIVRQVAAERAKQIEADQGFPVGRRQMRELKERVTEELRGRALTRRRITRAWIDPDQRLARHRRGRRGARRRADRNFARHARQPDVQFIETERSPPASMAAWLMLGDAPMTLHDRSGSGVAGCGQEQGDDPLRATSARRQVRSARTSLRACSRRASASRGRIASRSC